MFLAEAFIAAAVGGGGGEGGVVDSLGDER